MTNTVPVAVVIPTYNRGSAVLSVLERIHECDPLPAEIWIHVDRPDEILKAELKKRFPHVQILMSETRLGPGGGRHRCLQMCQTPYAVSFDDDSYPVDRDFFAQVEPLFLHYPQAAIFAARIRHRGEPEMAKKSGVELTPSYMGCGYAIRLAAYRQVRGYLARRVPYGMEETDLSLQLFATGWDIFEAGDLRVFHDTELNHIASAETNAGSITNVALFAFLHFPLLGWGRGFLQVGSRIRYSMRVGHFRGICSGLLRIPVDCYQNRQHRSPIPWSILTKFLQFQREHRRVFLATRSEAMARTSRMLGAG